MRLLASSILLAATGLVAANDPDPAESPAGSVGASKAVKPAVQFPPVPARPAEPPRPSPPNAPAALVKGQWYVIRSAIPLVINATGTGAVDLTFRDGKKRPLTLPAELVVGWPADADDPGFVTFADEFLYVVRAKTTGPVMLEIVRAVNPVDKNGKQVPLTRSDFVYKSVDVDAGTAPRPPPKPDEPDVPVEPKTDAPIKEPGLHVLIVYSKGKALPKEQVSILAGAETRAWLDKNCAAKPDGTRAYRVWYDDAETAGAPKVWQDAMNLKRDSLPWVIVSNGPGKGGYQGPLPADPAAFIKLAEKYK